ncbi:unnamed protein product [Brachionus calyciflorus]|uniref:Protein quiver n=1 Tax=Brachionus calyciflorus TaxID=104777 RepID=A0A813PZZ0_9BILA|nr:unnamed protein product [Brachionus calyciflorus]
MKFLISVGLFLALSSMALAQNQSGNKIRCYQCNQAENNGCSDPFKGDDTYLKECDNGETFCRKIVQNVNDVTTVIRQCAKELYKENYEGCYKTPGKASQSVCTCKGNSDKGCNSSLKLKSSILGFVMSIILSVVLLK